MTDKERILSAVISWLMPRLLYSGVKDRENCFENCLLEPSKLNKGDLVAAATAMVPNDYSVGFVHEIKDDCVVIRRIGSKKLCGYYNEGFYRINKEYLGYEALEGAQYRTYRKVLKAFDTYTGYTTRFKSISFEGDKCTVRAEKIPENSLYFEAAFEFGPKITVSEIGKILKENENRAAQETGS